MLYLLLFIGCIWVVVSSKINTDNSLKLIGIGFIAIGALTALAGKKSMLIDIGVFIYVWTNLLYAYFGTKKRRDYERA